MRCLWLLIGQHTNGIRRDVGSAIRKPYIGRRSDVVYLLIRRLIAKLGQDLCQICHGMVAQQAHCHIEHHHLYWILPHRPGHSWPDSLSSFSEWEPVRCRWSAGRRGPARTLLTSHRHHNYRHHRMVDYYIWHSRFSHLPKVVSSFKKFLE